MTRLREQWAWAKAVLLVGAAGTECRPQCITSGRRSHRALLGNWRQARQRDARSGQICARGQTASCYLLRSDPSSKSPRSRCHMFFLLPVATANGLSPLCGRGAGAPASAGRARRGTEFGFDGRVGQALAGKVVGRGAAKIVGHPATGETGPRQRRRLLRGV